VIHSDPEILGGTPVFVGTRVSCEIALRPLKAGDSLDVFLDSFPSVMPGAGRGRTGTRSLDDRVHAAISTRRWISWRRPSSSVRARHSAHHRHPVGSWNSKGLAFSHCWMRSWRQHLVCGVGVLGDVARIRAA
jgi:hypothetical protein